MISHPVQLLRQALGGGGVACTRGESFGAGGWRRPGEVLQRCPEPPAHLGTGGGPPGKGGRMEGVVVAGLHRGIGALAHMLSSHWGHKLSVAYTATTTQTCSL